MKKIILIVALFLSTTFQTLLCQAPSYVPSNGLMGWWPFNGNANDQSGNNLNGTVTGATLTSDRNGNQNSAYSFTTNQDITIPNTSNLNSYPLTVSLWYNVATLASTGESSNIFSKYVSSSWNGFHIFLFDARNINSGNTQYNDGYSVVPWYLRDTSNRVLGYYGETPFLQPNIQTNTWYHYVFTLDSSGGKIYVNNQLVDSHPWTGTPGASTNNFLWKIGGLYDTWFKGKIDDVGVWNRVLTPTEIQQLYTGCTTVAPSGTATQSFCEVGTVANLTATGTAIKWYAAATGGTALASTTALVNGTTYYASQTINGCESTSRFAVKVILNLTTLTASSTTICKGESVQITATNNLDSSFNWSTGQSEFINTVELAGQFSHISRSNYENTFNITPGDRYRLDISGNVSYGGGAGNQRDVAFYTATGSDGTIEGTALTSVCNSGTYTSGIYTSLFCDTPGLRPTPNVYDPVNHLYKYPFTAQSTRLTVGFWDTPLGDNAANTINFKLYRVLNNSSSITVTPTQTTTYWVDVTINGVTCRKSITITVNNTPTPTGATTQTFCSSNTVANLVATGTAIKWYAAATGGTALASTAVLVNGTTYYASQTLNGCESNTRLAVVATVLPNPSAPTGATQQTVCEATTIANLTATGTAIKWYATAIGGTALASTAVLVNGTTYYASQTVNSCESQTRLTVKTIINAATLSAANTTICAGQSTNLSISNSSSSLIQFQSMNPDLVLFKTIGSHSYFYKNEAISWEQAKAYGDQKGVSLYVINDEIEESLVFNSLPFKGNDGIQYWIGLYQDVGAINYSEPSGGWKWVDNSPLVYTNWYPGEPNNYYTGEKYGQIDWTNYGNKWNDADTNSSTNSCACNLSYPIYELDHSITYLWSTGATTSSISPSPTQTTTYWVDVTTNGVTCRKSITITVNNTPTPTGASTQTFCSSNTVANLVATGTAIKWYAAATGGTALASTAVLVNGTTYYASQTLNGCESNTRLAVVATVIPNPSAPTGATQQTVCEATTIANLTATGTAIKWYATAIGGTALANTTNLNGTNYYASQTVNGCESVSRLVVNVIINAATLSAANTTICAGQSTSLTTTLNLQSLNSCVSTSNTNFIAFTPITTTGNYVNIIKNNNNYFLRSNSNVLFSNNLLGPYTSLNYNTQIGIDLAGELLGVDNLNRLHVATGHDGLFKYNGTNWSSGGLTGFGTGGQYFTKLSNGRIVIAKSGYLRGIYYSDNNGDTWTKATNVDVDWNNITIASNGDLYASSGIGGADNKGIVKSTNNGSSWTYLNSTLGITTSTGVYKDCNDSLYIIGDNKIFKSRDIGVNWAQIANLPSFYNSFPSYGEFVVTSNGDFYYLGDGKLFYSSNHGNNWTEITSISGELKKIKEIDGNIVVCSTQGVFAKSLISPTYLWSTGATTDTINVSPTQTTTYWVDVTTNGVTCRKSIAITVNPKPEVPTQTLTVCNGVPFTFSPVNATPTAATVVPQGTTYTWTVASNPNVTGEANSSVSGISSISQTLINTTSTTQTVVYTVTPTSGAGCQGSPFTLTITLAALIPAPSAEIIQTFCTGAAISDLKATGTSGATIKWYSAYTGGTSISPNVSLVNGSIYYASQTINGCESLLRTGIIVGLTSPIITPSATTVCAGTNVTLASSTPIVLGVNNSILATILQNGLVGYWPFNSNANDMSGNGINGTVNGAVVTNDRYGNPNSAYQFDGIENTINQANPFFGGNQVSSFSFGALFNVSSTSNSPNIWGKTKFWGEVNLIIHNDNSIEFVWANSVTGNKYSSVRSTPNSIKLNTWNNVVVVFENSILKIYINGILVESNMKWTAQGGTILSTTRVEQYCNFAQDAGSNRFGIRNTGGFWGNYFKGTIDDVAIWNRALSPLEIQGLYAMTNTDYTWSTGAKTATISVSPLQTTTYWVDVTTYGVTCRKEVTVTIVNPPPTGNASQAFLPGDTIANLNVTGTNIKWYTSATGGSALPSNTPLVNGVVYYASQTINSCESLSRFGVTVTIFSLPFDNFSITTKSETCSGKNNGEITINATQVHPYIAKVNGTSYSFTNNSLSLPNLTPGIYSVCISVDGKIFQQCFTISIAKGGTLTGKSTFSSNKALVEITEGTAPFEVLVNGIPQFETNDTNFSVDVRQGDLLVVKTSVACEGIYSQNILEGLDQVIAHPNPTSGIFEITIPTSKENVEVELYTINAQLISKKNYKVNNHRVQLSLENQSEGVYIAKVNLDIPVSLTIIKKL